MKIRTNCNYFTRLGGSWVTKTVHSTHVRGNLLNLNGSEYSCQVSKAVIEAQKAQMIYVKDRFKPSNSSSKGLGLKNG